MFAETLCFQTRLKMDTEVPTAFGQAGVVLNSGGAAPSKAVRDIHT